MPQNMRCMVFMNLLLWKRRKTEFLLRWLVQRKINTQYQNALSADGKKHGEMDHNQETGMSVEDCVSQLLDALSKRKREVLIGNKEIKAVTLRRFSLPYFWKIIKNQSAT